MRNVDVQYRNGVSGPTQFLSQNGFVLTIGVARWLAYRWVTVGEIFILAKKP